MDGPPGFAMSEPSEAKTRQRRIAGAGSLDCYPDSKSVSWKMTAEDVRAIAIYLKDVAGQAPENNTSADKDVVTAGAAIYQDLCSACHASDGKGSPNLFPNLSEAATVSASDPATVLRVILQGAQSVATDHEPTGPAMPSFGWQLNDAQVAAIATYVRDQFGNKASPVGESDVRKARAALAAQTE